MRGLVDGSHRPVGAIRGEIGQHHRRVCERHQRLAAHHAAIAAEPLGERHAQDSAGLPILRVRRRLEIELLDRKVEILDPGRKHVAQHAPRLADAEPLIPKLLHERRSLPRFNVRYLKTAFTGRDPGRGSA
jgi:hypothetical protein